MKRDEVLRLLTDRREELRTMGVSSLELFGSTVREDAGENSDVDLLVEFCRPVGLFTFYRVQEYLEQVLGTDKVDLVVRGAVLDELKDAIYGEAIPCFEGTGSSASAT